MINIKGIEMELKERIEQEIKELKEAFAGESYESHELPAYENVLKLIDETSSEELEHCCKMLIGAGISTGHAGTFTELVEELMLNVVEALKSPWVPVSERLPDEEYLIDDLEEGFDNTVYLIKIEGISGFHKAMYVEGEWWADYALKIGRPVTHWQPISEIPK